MSSLIPKPRGRPPKNKQWDPVSGVWIDKHQPEPQTKPLKIKKKIKIISWNVAGIRAIIKKNVHQQQTFENFFQEHSPDIICLNETKITKDEDIKKIDSTVLVQYPHRYWNCCSIKHGYSGTAILSKHKPLSYQYGFTSENQDPEGRLITVEYQDFYLICVYTPNSGAELKRLDERVNDWDVKFREYVSSLTSKKPVVISGDLNCAHHEIDIKNPKSNLRSSGFTIEERTSFGKLLDEGFIDTFREQNPELVKYSYWNYRTGARSRNVGWRIDYFLVSKDFWKHVYISDILDQVLGSDHAPIILELKK